MKYNYQLPDENVNLPKENLLYFAMKLLVSLLIVATIAYFSISIAVNFAASYITPEQEKKLMEFASVDMNLSGSNNPYLTEITDKLQQCAKLPYDIKVYKLDMEQPNAFAVPGGSIYVTRGMLEKLESENELAFVIGHELGHFKNKDHIRGLGRSLLLSLISMFMGDSYGLALSTTLQISQAKYSQSAELDADSFGLEVMYCAYGSVRDASGFFEKMDDGDDWKYFLATHPDFHKRILNMKKQIKKKGYDINKDVLPLKEF
jgi:Zn-dependent protease with chaperone function